MVYGTQITNDIGVMCTNLAIQRGPHIVDKSSMYSIQANTIRSLRGLHNLESSQLSLFSDSVRHPTLRQLSFIYIYSTYRYYRRYSGIIGKPIFYLKRVWTRGKIHFK